jgi:Transglycosylase SLT domain
MADKPRETAGRTLWWLCTTVLLARLQRLGCSVMTPLSLTLPGLVACAVFAMAQPASAQTRPYDAMIASQASANGVPEALVHRVIVRESRYRADLIGRGGTIGLMQIKLATARSLGYTGTAEGLRDPETNLTYGVRYLAGAYRVANGNHNRAITYYAGGYYRAQKHQRRMPLVLHAMEIPPQ